MRPLPAVSAQRIQRCLVWLAFLLFLVGGPAIARTPLTPDDTSSPRATLQSFLDLTDEVQDRYRDYRDDQSPTTQRALGETLQRAWSLLDLSKVAEAARHEVGAHAFLALWEVIARLEIPPLDQVPDAGTVRARSQDKDPLTLWRFPDTDIVITQVSDGDQAGRFLFSPETVRRAPEFYERIKALPYLRPMPVASLLRIQEIGTGWMIPMRWVEALPPWANLMVFGQVVWKWLALGLLLILFSGLIVTVFRWSRRRPMNAKLGSYLRHLSAPALILILAPIARFLFQAQINPTGRPAEAADYLIVLAIGLAWVWALWVTSSWIADAVIASPRINPRSLNASLIRLGARSVGMLGAFVLLLRVANDVGVPVYGLVAGAGVGGLAIALAARSTLENFIAALNLFADRPIRVGDLCRYDEDSSPGWRPVGSVEAIGLRSTKIRRMDRSLVTIPNAEFAQKNIVNLSACDQFLLATTLGLRYETSADQLRYVLASLREMLLAHPKTIDSAEQPVRVRFIGFGDYSLDVAVRAYVHTTRYNEFLAIQEDILLRIIKLVEDAGAGFAFPSQTLYHTRDGRPDPERRESAEKQVKEWAAAHTLPFPDFDENYRKQIIGTLDYPPTGSPGADLG
jgi:MscS family membrane protein